MTADRKGANKLTNLLITGGAGFIGSNLVKYILENRSNISIRVIDDLSTGSKENLRGLEVEFYEGSILDESLMSRVCAGIDSIVHLAALPSVPRSIANPIATHTSNATGTLVMLESARRAEVNHVVVASSSSVYGANPSLPKSEGDWTSPASPYAVSKLTTESYAIAYQPSFGMATVAFRFFNVYGPGQRADHAYAAVIPKFIKAALTEGLALIEGDGLQSRDFTYVGTVCEVLTRAVEQRTCHARPVNLAYGTNTTVLEALGAIEEVVGKKIRREFVSPRKGDVRASQAKNESLRELFPGIDPVVLYCGLTRTVDWYKGELAE